ncbi:MAG TPA: glycosyltransferase [Opitutaceae bacterium]
MPKPTAGPENQQPSHSMGNPPASKRLTVAIVIPVFDDWPSAAVLLGLLDRRAGVAGVGMTVTLVDDGSTQPLPEPLLDTLQHLERVELLQLHCNLGHQRAIAVGLSRTMQGLKADAVIVMDSDGEDSPDDLFRLIERHTVHPEAIVVASRSKRSEGVRFRLFYRVYKIIFRLLTGKTIDFGNFCLLPAGAALRIIHTADCWNHLAASIVRSRLPLERVHTARASRLAGRSSMNLVGLVTHGFSAISVFSDVVLTRLLILAAATAVMAAATGLTAGALRLFTDLAIPGWASSVVGFSVLLLFQTLSLLAVMIFMSLSNRSSVLFVPALLAADYIRAIHTIHPRNDTRGSD